MDFRVIFTKKALRDLEAIARFVAKDNSDAAINLRDKLLERALELSRFPRRYPKGRLRAGVREMPVGSYIVHYSVDDARHTVNIIHFWHSSRQPPFL